MVLVSGRLDGKVALVTGSSRGIGRAIALGLAGEGANVVVTWRANETGALEVRDSILGAGGGALCVRLDVTVRESVRGAIRDTVSRFGSLDILVNNAGVLTQKPFETIADDDWDETVDCNLKGVFICCQEAAPQLLAVQGSVVNIASVGGQIGGTKAVHYAASKAGLISLTRSLANLWAPRGVRVNAVAPGFIRTDMFSDISSRESEQVIAARIPLGHVGEPEDVSAAVLFLASQDGRYVTGQILNVNGGTYLG